MDYTKWEFHNSKPIYKQLYQRLLIDILSEKLMPGECIPSIRIMASTLRINANTVARVYKLLLKDGLIQTTGGKSRVADVFFIQEKRKQEAQRLCTNYINAMMKLGFSREETVSFVSEYEQSSMGGHSL